MLICVKVLLQGSTSWRDSMQSMCFQQCLSSAEGTYRPEVAAVAVMCTLRQLRQMHTTQRRLLCPIYGAMLYGSKAGSRLVRSSVGMSITVKVWRVQLASVPCVLHMINMTKHESSEYRWPTTQPVWHAIQHIGRNLLMTCKYPERLTAAWVKSATIPLLRFMFQEKRLSHVLSITSLCS